MGHCITRNYMTMTARVGDSLRGGKEGGAWLGSDYVKIFRSLLDWGWYRDEHTKSLFLHCLLKANWRDGTFRNIEVRRGQLVTSIPRLESELGLTSNEVRTAIKHLKSTGEITVKSYPKFSVFTVVNYSSYQCTSQAEPQADHRQGTDKPQPINSLLTAIEEGKKGKKERREEYSRDADASLRQTEAVRRVLDEWNSLEGYGIKPVTRLTPTSKRYQSLAARLREYSEEDVVKAIGNIRDSDFLQGKGKGGWQITFDWLVLPNNFPKVLEGQYGGNHGGRKQEGISEVDNW